MTKQKDLQQSHQMTVTSGESDRWLQSEKRWTTNPQKRRRFEQECYLQEALVELSEIAGGRLDAIDNKSFIVFKPDAAPARRVRPTMEVLQEYGIRPIAARLFTFGRLTVRELWRYELNVSTYARYPAIDALLTDSPSLFVLLECEPQAKEGGLATFLDALKGPSRIDRREPHHLRSRIAAGDGVLNHIHTPSETIDLLREVAVIFDRSERNEILERLARRSNAQVDIDVAAGTFEASAEPHSLSVREVRDRLLAQKSDLDFEGLLASAAGSLEFSMFEQELRALGVCASRWDAMTLFVAQRQLMVEGIVPVLEYVSATEEDVVDD